jgi:hypothetical protein
LPVWVSAAGIFGKIEESSAAKNGMIVGGLAIAAFIGFIVWEVRAQRKTGTRAGRQEGHVGR